MWGIALCVAMCMGPDRVGFLSGSPFVREPRLNDNPDEQQQQQQQQQESKPRRQQMSDPFHSRATRIRVLFLVSGVVVIVFSILFVTRGLTKLQTTVDTVHDSSLVTQQITTEGRVIIDVGLREFRSKATSVRTTLLNELNRDIFCPADPSLQNSAVARDIRPHLDNALEALGEMEGFQDETLAEFEEALLDIEDSANDVEETADDTDLIGWEAMIVVMPYTIITALLMAAAIMAAFDVEIGVLSCWIKWFLLPLFILITSFVCCLAFLTAMAAGANSDFCLPNGDENGSPDENVPRIMLADGYKEDDYDFRMIRYFSSQCTHEDNPFEPLQEYLPSMVRAPTVKSESILCL